MLTQRSDIKFSGYQIKINLNKYIWRKININQPDVFFFPHHYPLCQIIGSLKFIGEILQQKIKCKCLFQKYQYSHRNTLDEGAGSFNNLSISVSTICRIFGMFWSPTECVIVCPSKSNLTNWPSFSCFGQFSASEASWWKGPMIELSSS